MPPLINLTASPPDPPTPSPAWAQIFDWLRGLDEGHDLYALCNTMTYTTMISQCGSQQALRRALELVAEMRSRGIQANVHTYSALMNVCIKGACAVCGVTDWAVAVWCSWRSVDRAGPAELERAMR